MYIRAILTASMHALITRHAYAEGMRVAYPSFTRMHGALGLSYRVSARSSRMAKLPMKRVLQAYAASKRRLLLVDYGLLTASAHSAARSRLAGYFRSTPLLHY